MGRTLLKDLAIMRGLELQHKTRARVTQTAQGYALTIRFSIGPLSIFIIAGLPDAGNGRVSLTAEPLVYVKANLAPSDDWTLFKDHGSD